jgi:hypothetical protein
METLPIRKLGYSLSNDEIMLNVLKDSKSNGKFNIRVLKNL